MTLPKKASRAIEVNGKTFRWMVKKVDDDGQARLTVEDSETGEIRQRMYRGWAMGDGPEAVTPGDVKQFIIERF